MHINMERPFLWKIVCLLVLVISFKTWAEEDRLLDVSKLEKFVDELQDMPKIQGYELANGVFKPKAMAIGMYRKKWKFHRDIPPTPVFAYGETKFTATVPGPTIEAVYGVDTYVTWKNHLPSRHILPWDPTVPIAIPTKGVPTVVHLHGNLGDPDNDGYAMSWFTKGFRNVGPTWKNKTYHYLNEQQPGTMWYHDHAMGLTRVNLLAGLIGTYIVRQPVIESRLRLPSGAHDRSLVIFDRAFRTNGSLYMNSTGDNPSIHQQWQPEYFGDAIVVNGKVWPRMTVQRRKYRFRIVNACNARFLRLHFPNGLKFIYVGSDSAYLGAPVATNTAFIAPSEIADVVIDFSKSMTDTVVLHNDAPYPYPSGDPPNDDNGKVMKFFIDKRRVLDTSHVPEKLISYPSSNPSNAAKTRFVALFEYESKTGDPTHLLINAKSFDDPVTETPKQGTTEIWNIINLTEDNHPLHIHLGLFSVLEQTKLVNEDEFKECMNEKNDAVKCQIDKYARGRKVAVVAHEKGWKNVYKMMPGYLTKILVRFAYIHSDAPYAFDATSEPGYVYHCHILDHEDNVMMRPFKLIK